jgi:HD superfamily phosphohydrolase
MTRRRSDLDEEQVKFLLAIATDSQRRRALEDEIASRAKIDSGYVCIDVPSVKLLLSEPRMADVDIRVRGEDGRYRWFKEHTPMADALRTRQVSQAALYVTTLPSAVERVGKIAERLLFQ